MARFDVPDGLPAGRFLPPASLSLWQSDAPVAEPLRLWARCQQSEDATRVWPVLSDEPTDPWPASDPAEITAFQLEAELEASWRALREYHLSGQDVPENLPEDIEPWEKDSPSSARKTPSAPPRKCGHCSPSTRHYARSSASGGRLRHPALPDQLPARPRRRDRLRRGFPPDRPELAIATFLLKILLPDFTVRDRPTATVPVSPRKPVTSRTQAR